jgi:hypothetical protein
MDVFHLNKGFGEIFKILKISLINPEFDYSLIISKPSHGPAITELGICRK